MKINTESNGLNNFYFRSIPQFSFGKLEPRLESFTLRETPLFHCPRLGSILGFPNLYIKWEGANPSGSQKDRIAVAHLQMATIKGNEALVAATCGNYGRSLSLLSSYFNLKAHIFLPSSFLTSRLESILRTGGKVTFCKGSYELAVDEANSFADSNSYWNANPGFHPNLEYLAYENISKEILKQLKGVVPDVVAIPASNGVTVVGMAQGFDHKLPLIVAGTTLGGNPILTSFNQGAATCKDLDPLDSLETEVNSPLVNWKALAGDEALHSIYNSKGTIKGVSDNVLQSMSDLLLKTEGILALPAATAGLCALLAKNNDKLFRSDAVIVAVITGSQN